MRLLASIVCALAVSLGAVASAPAANSGPDAYGTAAELLSQRVRDIAAETPAGKFPIGTGRDLKLRLASGSNWNSGFLAGALWRVYDLSAAPVDREAAFAATVNHFGFEGTEIHDLGFMYGESSVAGANPCTDWDPRCKSLKQSGRQAAATLLKLSKTTAQRIIPMSSKTCSDCARGSTETIVDSMMNLPLLYWAARSTGKASYRALARRHADWVAKHLERADGSTYQAGRYVRGAEHPRIVRHTHQGLSNSSVWSRGQAWSLYGFADAAREFKSKRYLAIAERNASYIDKHLPKNGVPQWDYRAGAGAPRDVSAGVISAAGLFHLAAACKSVFRGCARAERWPVLARKILSGSLANIRTADPVGYLGGMVYTKGGRTSWDDDAELVFGLDYALEAISLARQTP